MNLYRWSSTRSTPRFALARPFPPAGEDQVDPCVDPQLGQLDDILAVADPPGIVDQDDHRGRAALLGVAIRRRLRISSSGSCSSLERYSRLFSRLAAYTRAGAPFVRRPARRCAAPTSAIPSAFPLRGYPPGRRQKRPAGSGARSHRASGGGWLQTPTPGSCR